MIGYYTSKITDNIGRTPEDFLVCRDAVIGRTGFQTYKGEELLREHGKDKLKDLGLDDVSPAADIRVFRDPSEVFHPDTLRSFEGKPFTDNHPPGFVTPDNITLYQKGHIQNVRKGKEPLDSGDWPMLADIVVTDAPLAAEIENGERPDLSSGYGYGLKAHNGTLWQVDIVGNHVARVPKGRAGSDARIYDAAPVDAEAKPQLQPTKRYKMKNPFKHLLGLGVKAMAADANTDPEDLAEAVKEASKFEPSSGDREGRARAHDEFPPEKEKKEEKKEGKDAAADDHGARMHAALDRVLARKADDMRSKDADLEALKGLMSEYFNEEKGEPEHADDAMCDDAQGDVTDPGTEGTAGFDESGEKREEEEGKADDRHADDRKADDRKADDAAHSHDAVPTFASAERRRSSAFGADAVGGAAFVLKAMKPHIAKACQLAKAGRGNDAARHLTRAFDTVATSVNATARRTGTGDGYRAFSEAANDRSDEAKRSAARGRAADAEANDADTPGSPSEARTRKLNELMKSRFRVSLQEVK